MTRYPRTRTYTRPAVVNTLTLIVQNVLDSHGIIAAPAIKTAKNIIDNIIEIVTEVFDGILNIHNYRLS